VVAKARRPISRTKDKDAEASANLSDQSPDEATAKSALDAPEADKLPVSESVETVEPDTFGPESEAQDVVLSNETLDVPDADETAVEPDKNLDRDAAKDAQPEDVMPAAAASIPPSRQRQSGFLPLVFGGIVAAMMGFILGRADQFDALLPESMQRKEVDVTSLEAANAALAEQTAALLAKSDSLEDRLDAIAPTDTSALEAALFELAEQVAALEARPVAPPVTGDIPDEIQSIVGQLQSAIQEQSGQIAELRDAANAAARADEESAQQILARAAVTRVVTAIESGTAYEPALTDLEETGVLDIPEAITDAAMEGVPAMAALVDAFPDAARAALAATRESGATPGGIGLGDFLKRQLGARSVTPREGSDADAILSRAEAALRSGDLSAALTEVSALPDVAQAEMADWVAQAQTRQTALDAANAMAQSLKAN
jgi:hypothetical protein